ncbi:transmembrane protein 208 isoform X2 [Papilio machaon]|uniref:transmembrane protein 208 isoform X2 n=1 Tax=Papilio machaon TaxID=76193 RepID=UPI001E662E62|nr:transmembrane protein 208 isoform X2 [Papilio machaon]XP_014361957.2 transmembrane protein 208 isoform X2 [Papilio machaon]
MSPPPKGKAPTKGAKQILAENTATVTFYRNMSLGATAFFNIITFIFFYDQMTTSVIFMNVLVTIIYVVCYQMMKFISRPKYTTENVLLDPGLDLNMEGGMGEHVKDIVILSSITHLLALISNYFWLLLLLIPLRGFWLVWVNFLGPWFFQEAPEDTEQDEKKRKKMERKMKRYQQ